VAVVLAAGCGGGKKSGTGGTPGTPSGGGTRTVSCLYAGDHCETLTATLTDADQTAIQGGCAGDGGTFSASACSTTGMMSGTCRYTGAQAVALGINFANATLVQHFVAATYSAAEAEAFCAGAPAGTWVP